MGHNVGSVEHVALYGVAAAGEEGVPRDVLLESRELLDRCGSGNGPISFLIEGGMKKDLAEKTMRDPAGMQQAIKAYFSHVVSVLVSKGRIVDTDGILTIGRLPRGYNPITEDEKRSKGLTRVNLVGARRKAKGWSNYTNPLDDNVVAQMAETMVRKGWPKGHNVLVDADGYVADGKHHVEAAKVANQILRSQGLEEITVVTKVIADEIALWEEVESRNIDRWHGTASEVAAIRASFIALRPDLTVGEKLESLRRSYPNTSERTQRRATAEVKEEMKEERDETILEGLAAGKTQRQVSEETGVPKSTVADIAKEAILPENGQDGRNRADPPPKPVVIGTCCVCKHETYEGEPLSQIIEAEPGFLIGIPMRGKGKGGANAMHGPIVKTGKTAHTYCMSREAQLGYR